MPNQFPSDFVAWLQSSPILVFLAIALWSSLYSRTRTACFESAAIIAQDVSKPSQSSIRSNFRSGVITASWIDKWTQQLA